MGRHVFEFVGLGLFEGVAEADLAVGDAASDLLFEAVITEDELELIVAGEVLNVFLGRQGGTGSPRSIKAWYFSVWWSKVARTGSERLSCWGWRSLKERNSGRKSSAEKVNWVSRLLLWE